MKPIFSVFASASTIYDFADDSGTVGVKNLNLVIPKNVIVTKFFARTWIDAASGGFATISVDRIVGAVVTTGFFMVATAFSNFVTTPGSEVLPGVDFNANPLVLDPDGDSQIGLTIAVAPLTAGRIQFVFNLQYTDQLI